MYVCVCLCCCCGVGVDDDGGDGGGGHGGGPCIPPTKTTFLLVPRCLAPSRNFCVVPFALSATPVRPYQRFLEILLQVHALAHAYPSLLLQPPTPPLKYTLIPPSKHAPPPPQRYHRPTQPRHQIPAMSVVGVDLGTLNSVIAVARNRGVDVVSASPPAHGFVAHRLTHCPDRK